MTVEPHMVLLSRLCDIVRVQEYPSCSPVAALQNEHPIVFKSSSNGDSKIRMCLCCGLEKDIEIQEREWGHEISIADPCSVVLHVPKLTKVVEAGEDERIVRSSEFVRLEVLVAKDCTLPCTGDSVRPVRSELSLCVVISRAETVDYFIENALPFGVEVRQEGCVAMH